MKRMAEDDELRIHLAEGGLRRVHRDFAWHKKAAFISQAYLQMIRPAGTA